jgi:predicted ATPase/DNA-binding winged helix-turn-helix (wHTH) protein
VKSSSPGENTEEVESDEALAFGDFRLFPARKLLLEAGKPVGLGGRAFDILNVLAEGSGRVIGKDELIARVWPGVFVEEGNLRVHIAALRRILGDGQGGRRYIVTTPGRGYSLIEPVSHLGGRLLSSQDVAKEPSADNLPGLVTKMVGRDVAVEALVTQLPKRRFITIIGPGGIGKTTVALAAAAAARSSYRDGVRLVDLAPIADPALVPSVLASVLGLPVSSDNPIPNLIALLKDKQMLLVLDNCEHVVDVAATLAEQIFRGAPHVHILATSREALRVRGERTQHLPPLESPPASVGLTAVEAMAFPAVQLFVECASATLDSFDLSDADAPVVAEICRRLDGIALAIELAAGRVDTFGARGVADRLDDRFRLLTRGHRTALPHHQTLRAMFDWSYGVLSAPAKTVLGRLATFAGSFSLDSAAAIAGAGDVSANDVAEHVATLVSTSLVVADVAGEAVSYRLLDSTRAYARERLIETGEFDQIARRHAEYFRDLLQPAEAASATMAAEKWISVYALQLDNLRIALDWAFSPQGDPRTGIDLAIVAAPIFSRLSLNEECRSRVETALASLGPETNLADGRAMRLFAALGSALSYTRRSNPESSNAWRRALEIAEAVNDVDYQLRALRGLWTNAYSEGNIGSAITLAERFSTIAAMSSDPADTLNSDRLLGLTFFYRGKLKAARAHTESAMNGNTTTKTGLNVIRFQLDQRMLTSTALSKILWLQGFPDQAVSMAQRSIGYARAADHELSVAHALAYSACRIALLTGDLEGMERYITMLFQQSLLDPLGQWDLFARCWKGALLNRRGDVAAAAHLLASALEEIPEGSFRMHYTRFLGELAYALGRVGEASKALGSICKAIEISDKRDERWFFPELLRIKGEIVLLDGGPQAVAEAEGHFQDSIDWAQRQGALSWEMRASTNLAQLRIAQGRSSDAGELLAAVYGRFTEGFATSDLVAAESLLQMVSTDARMII